MRDETGRTPRKGTPMTAPRAEASHGLDFEFRPRDYPFRSLTRAHGGAGLPPCQPGEAEIARITAGTVDADVCSLRVRCAGGRFQYRIVDQYFTQWRLQARTSRLPLTLGEVIRLIDSARPRGWDPSPEALANLWRGRLALARGPDAALTVNVSSAVYPALEEYYERQGRSWLLAQCGSKGVEHAA